MNRALTVLFEYSPWFVPLCLALGAMVLSRVTLAIDRRSDLAAVLDWLVPGKPAAVAANATIVAATMLTFFGVVFSTTLIAVQLAGSQYSPRIVRVFVRSRLTQLTLGVFLATFMFALNTLLAGERTGPSSSRATTGATMYVLMLATVGMFIAYLHGMVRLRRVQYLLRLT